MGNNKIIKTIFIDSCIVCNSTGHPLYSSLSNALYHNTVKWQFYRCTNKKCNHIWLNPKPLKDEIWKIYEVYYTHSEIKNFIKKVLKPIADGYYALNYHYNKDLNIYKKLIGLLMYLIPTEKVEFDYDILYLSYGENKKLLDIGCGNGDLIDRLRKKGWNADGIEVDQKSVELCNKRNLNVRLGEVTETDLPNNYYDIISINHVIEHHYDPRALIRRSYELLKSGGKLIIVTPNSNSLSLKIFGSSWFSLDPPAHLNLFNPGNLIHLINEAGFKKVNARTTSRNEYWVYYGSRVIQKKGSFNSQEERKSYIRLIIGKLYQLFISFVLVFFKNVGGEVVIIAAK